MTLCACGLVFVLAHNLHVCDNVIMIVLTISIFNNDITHYYCANKYLATLIAQSLDDRALVLRCKF